MVSSLEPEMLQVEDIPGELERDDLAIAVARRLVAARISIEQQATCRCRAAFTDEICIRSGRFDRHGQLPDGLKIVSVEIRQSPEFRDQRCDIIFHGGKHGSPRRNREVQIRTHLIRS